jgi:hypothetical protein
MSKDTLQEFKQAVLDNYSQHSEELTLSPPQFEESGFLASAVLSGDKGFVEMLCGPPEYHAELFIQCFDSNRRWELADLLGSDSVQQWVARATLDSSEGVRVRREVDWLFLLVATALRTESEFGWLFSRRG